jgi:tRNA-specific adenosine deaminase 1
MASAADSTPWVPATDLPSHLRGRSYFSALGAVRTKPGRADSPATSSKSCSDKLSLRQCVSLLLTPTSYLLSPRHAYIDTLVLPEAGYSVEGCARAFGVTGRMSPLAGRTWDGGYTFAPFKVVTTKEEFEFSRRSGAGPGGSNLAAVMVKNRGSEVLIGGVLQGRKAFSGEKAGSMLCKARIWRAVAELGVVVGGGGGGGGGSYGMLKEAAVERETVKSETRKALGGWIRTGGDNFELAMPT